MNVTKLLFILIFIAGIYYIYNLIVNTVTYAGQQGRFLIQVLLAVIALLIVNEGSKMF